MRLSKTALLAASVISSSFALAVNYDTRAYDTNINVVAGDPAVLDASFSGAINRLTGEGEFIKNGAGVLQYKGFQVGTDFYNRSSVVYTSEAGVAVRHTTNLFSAFPDTLSGNFDPIDNGFTGSITVNSGELQVAGYLNVWIEWSVSRELVSVNPLVTVPLASNFFMEGISDIRLNDTARLSFTNTSLNVSAGAATQFSATTNHDLRLTKRYNMVRNLTVGGLEGGAKTVLDTGADKDYRIVVHMENDGSVGILAGQGDFIKTGPGELRVLGSAERGLGRVVVGGGQLVLADSAGAALATASSVNLVGRDGRRGGALAGDYKGTAGGAINASPNDFWRPAFIPEVGSGSSEPSIVLNSSQTIRNLQADFAFTVAADPAVKTVANAVNQARFNGARDEAYLPGEGGGTFIDIGVHTLTLNQDRDAIYRGSINGTGKLVVNIAKDHRFALFLENGLEAALEIKGAGTFIANASGLGSGKVTVNGNLDLYQDNAGTLNALLDGGGSVSLTDSAILNNSLSGLDAANNMEVNANRSRGTLAVSKVQSLFTGTFRVLDGQTLELSSSADNALAASAGVTLEGGDVANGGRIATLRISDGVQSLKSLTGSANSLVDLGRGTLTLKAGSLGGSTTGVGTLIADAGSSTFSLDASRATYLGATVVKSGVFTAVGGMTNSSGLVLNSGATFNGSLADQNFGALFGQAGSTVNMGSRTLTVGLNSARIAQLKTEISGGNLLAANYLGTSALAVDLNNAAIGNFDTSTAFTIGDTVATGTVMATGQVLPVGLVLPAGTLLPGVSAANYTVQTNGSILINVRSTLTAASTLPGSMVLTASLSLKPDFGPTGTIADATRLFLEQLAKFSPQEASALAFAGSITGTGGLTKIGSEALTLTGANIYTGATSVQGGILKVNFNSLAATSGVSVSDGATLALNAELGEPTGTFDLKVTGAAGANLNKVGDGKVTLTGDISGYAGNITVQGGTLQVNSPAALVGDITINAATTLILNENGTATTTGAVDNSGTLVKNGGGSLTLSSYAGSRAVQVAKGTLALSLDAIAGFPSALDVASGATFRGAFTAPLLSSVVVTSTGTVSLSGAGATLTAGANDLFRTVTLDLQNVSFDLAGTSQQVNGFSGDAASSVVLNVGTLVFAPVAGVSTTFSGTVTGTGFLVKADAGNTSLTSTVDTRWSGTTTVSGGTIEATPESLGSSSVYLLGGTLALRNDNTATAVNYGNNTSVAAGATLAKTGAGEVVFSSGVAGYVGAIIAVNQGRFTTADDDVDAVFTGVTVASGASYRVNMSGNRIHDSATSVSVAGAGSLAVANDFTLTLTGTQSYAGNTILIDGADLNVAGPGVVNGLATEGAGQGGSLVTTGGALIVTQNLAGTFAGRFTPATALTVQGAAKLAITGDLTAAGLASVAVNGGILEVDTANTTAVLNNGTVAIASSAGATGPERYTGEFTGTGATTLVGPQKISFGDGVTSGVTGTPYVLGSTGLLTVASGATLGGVFDTSGGLTVASGGTLAPGNSTGTVTVNGNFTLASGGTLAVEINATTSDRVVVNGAASIAGNLVVTQDATPGSVPAAGAQAFTIVSATGGVTGAFSNASSTGMIQLTGYTPGYVGVDPATGLKRAHVGIVGNTVVVTGVKGLRDVSGFQQHDGLGDLVGLLDSGLAPAAVQPLVDNAWGSGATSLVNNLSPLGYASEYAMAQDGENRRVALLHDRLEARRYDRGSPLTTEDAPWEAFVVGSAAFADNKVGADTPTFDYRTFGGMAGLDRKLNDELVVGAAVSYDNGTATIHDAGGKVDMNRAAGTLFLGGQLTKRWYFDLGLTGGVGQYESKRDTALGRVKGENTGFSGGLNAETGTIVVLAKELHLTPYVGAAYTHHEYEGFTETGGPAALKLDAWSQDSLRAKAGTGLGWFVPMEWVNLKVGLDLAYAHELLDTESGIDAQFVSGGPKFRTTAAAIPQDTITATPSLGIEFNDSTSATFSYAYEMGFDGRSSQSINFAVRKRF